MSISIYFETPVINGYPLTIDAIVGAVLMRVFGTTSQPDLLAAKIEIHQLIVDTAYQHCRSENDSGITDRLALRFTIEPISEDAPNDATLILWMGLNKSGRTQTLSIPLPHYAGDPEGDAAELSSGMGLSLAKQLMDEVHYEPESGRNRWQLVKKLESSVEDGEISTEIAELLGRTFQLELPATHRYLNVMGEFLVALLSDLPELADKDRLVAVVQLAVQEICTNIVDHAYAGDFDHTRENQIWVTITLEEDTDDPNSAAKLVISTRDSGKHTFDITTIPDPLGASLPLGGGSVGGGLLKGSMLFFVSTTIVNGGNYLFNLILGRWLGPAAFADLNLIITLFLVVSFVTAGYQQTAAKFSAIHHANGDDNLLGGLRRWLGRNAWIVGTVVMLILGAGAPFWQTTFNTESFWPFVILAVSMPFYFAQGIDRGLLQGETRFGILALTYQAEMWVRLVISIALVALGWSVGGATIGVSISILAAWLIARQAGRGLPPAQMLDATERRAILLFAGPVIVAETSLILINNSDVLIVKLFFDSATAGHYAALALIGRMVFFATWSIVVTMFPVVAQRQERGEDHRSLLFISLGMVSVVSIIIIGATLIMPNFIVTILFGEAYQPIVPLLWLYAVATALYALGNVIVNYRLSLGNGLGTTFALVAGVAQVAALWFFHASLAQVVLVQIAIMGSLFIALIIWEVYLMRTSTENA
ncbi:MAG: oligosaccharide flippase family protein [Chloroflexota bacterium]